MSDGYTKTLKVTDTATDKARWERRISWSVLAFVALSVVSFSIYLAWPDPEPEELARFVP